MSSQINILFAEDHKLVRQLLISALEKYDIITIGEAEDGFQLLELLKTKKPDLILLDVEMPNMNGSQTFDKIKQLYPDLKVIFLTLHESAFLAEYFYSKGARGYLTKNADTEILVETIRLIHENNYFPIYKKNSRKSKDPENLNFNKRELEIIPLICNCKSNKEIGDFLHISIKTVEAHKKNLFRKTKTIGVVECVLFLIKKGLNNLK